MFTVNIILGVFISMIFISVVTWFVLNKTKDLIDQSKVLFLLVFLIAILTSVWVCDKIVATKIDLLTKDESAQIFNIIDHIISMTLGYYFGIKQQNDKTL